MKLWCHISAACLSLVSLIAVSTNASATAECSRTEAGASIPRVDGSALRAEASNQTAIGMAIVEEATRLLHTYGAVVIEKLVDPANMETLKADLSDKAGTFFGSKGSFAGEQTTRNAAKCLGESKVAQDLAINSVTVGIVKRVLEPFTKRVVLGTNSAISVVGPRSPDEPPAPPQVIHRDDSMWSGDWITNMACSNPNYESLIQRFPQLSVSVMWAASDFTSENGATRVALGSHHQCPRTTNPPPDTNYSQAVMPQGSVLLWLGGTFHGAASAKPYDATLQRKTRHGLLFIYNLGLLRSEHNFFNAIPNDILRSFDEELLDLLGYYGENAVDHPWYIGPVYTQPYLGGPQGASAGGEGVQFVVDPDTFT